MSEMYRQVHLNIPYRVKDGRVSWAFDVVEPINGTVNFTDGTEEHSTQYHPPTVQDMIRATTKTQSAYSRTDERQYNKAMLSLLVPACAEDPFPLTKINKLYYDDYEFLLYMLILSENIETGAPIFSAPKDKIADETFSVAEGLKYTLYIKRHSVEERDFVDSQTKGGEKNNNMEYQARLAMLCMRYMDADGELHAIKDYATFLQTPWPVYQTAIGNMFGRGMWKPLYELLEGVSVSAGGGENEPFLDVLGATDKQTN